MWCRNLVTLFATAVFASAANLTVNLVSSPALANPSTLPPSTHAILLGPPGISYDASIRKDNTFEFTELERATYLLTIHSRDHIFPQLRVDVSASEDQTTSDSVEAWQTFLGNEWSNKGPSYGHGSGKVTIEVRAVAAKQFYQDRESFSLLALLKSPMILMGLFSVVMIFGMPYLLSNSRFHHGLGCLSFCQGVLIYFLYVVDEETRAELDEMQKKGAISGQNGAASQIQNFDLAGWMAGKPTAPKEATQSTS